MSWDDADDWDDDPEGWTDDDADSLTFPCPECGTEVYEDAEQCPACGHWITESSGSRAVLDGKPMWYLVLALLGVVAVIVALARP